LGVEVGGMETAHEEECDESVAESADGWHCPTVAAGGRAVKADARGVSMKVGVQDFPWVSVGIDLARNTQPAGKERS
jgi:hypothetical protein